MDERSAHVPDRALEDVYRFSFASGASSEDDRNFSADDSAIGEMGRAQRKGACGGELFSIETYMFIITERQDSHPLTTKNLSDASELITITIINANKPNNYTKKEVYIIEKRREPHLITRTCL